MSAGAHIKKIISEIMAEFHQNNLQESAERDMDIPLESGKIITVTGPRRSGKSHLFFNLMKKLLKNGVKKESLIYFNFEDERLNISVSELDMILQVYRELYPGTNLKNCWFFFDELQNVAGWEKFVRRIYDNYTKNIFVTGSNAAMLGNELATALRGRTVRFEVLPLSFTEYLRFNKTDHKKNDPASKAMVNSLFDKYLSEGGFPELLNISEPLKVNVLQEYFDVMIYRDLLQRYNFSNLNVVKYFLKRLAVNTCQHLSLNKIYNELRSQGYKLDKNLLYDVHEATENTYLGLSVRKFDHSLVKIKNSEKKSYFIDNGLLNALTIKFSRDYGRLLENLIYIELRRRNYNIFYYKNGKECDFIVNIRDGTPSAIQICYDIQDNETREREVTGLLHACKKLGLKKGTVITRMDSGTEKSAGIRVGIIPAPEFCLETAAIL